MRSPLLGRLEIELPIIQAPMAGVQDSELAIAVANAGGLGSLPCAMLNAESLHTELEKLRAQASGIFNLNFFCHAEPAFDAARDARWRAALQPYFEEFQVDAQQIAPGSGRAPFSHAIADVIEPFKPPIVSFHFGLPTRELLARVKAWDAFVISSATTIEEARWLEAHGADAVIAQGYEAGGHRGSFLADDLNTQLGTFALLPQIVHAVNLPVIAAGGIVDADGVNAAMSLGASAVQIGTSYLLCSEATTSAVHRAALQSASAQTTAITNVFSGRPARGIVNRLMRELGYMSDAAPAFPLATHAIAPLRREAERRGSGDFSPLWAGQNVSGCKSIAAAQLTRELARTVAR